MAESGTKDGFYLVICPNPESDDIWTEHIQKYRENRLDEVPQGPEYRFEPGESVNYHNALGFRVLIKFGDGKPANEERYGKNMNLWGKFIHVAFEHPQGSYIKENEEHYIGKCLENKYLKDLSNIADDGTRPEFHNLMVKKPKIEDMRDALRALMTKFRDFRADLYSQTGENSLTKFKKAYEKDYLGGSVATMKGFDTGMDSWLLPGDDADTYTYKEENYQFDDTVDQN